MIKRLPEKLKELRTKFGYSQREVAKQLNVSPSIISGYETGERTPSIEVLFDLSRLYRCSTDYLLGRDPTQPTPSLDATGLSPKQVQLVAELINELKSTNQPSLLSEYQI